MGKCDVSLPSRRTHTQVLEVSIEIVRFGFNVELQMGFGCLRDFVWSELGCHLSAVNTLFVAYVVGLLRPKFS